MGAAVCKQQNQTYGEEIIQNQNDVQVNNMTFAKEQSSKLDGSNLKHPSLQKKIITQVTEKLPDDPINLSNNQSSILYEERQEPTTPALPTHDVIQQNVQQQHFQKIYLLNKEEAQSVKMNSTQKLVSSQQEEILQQFKEQTSQYSKSCKDDNRQKLLNINLVEDNLDDYIYFDWKNSNFQLTNINEQNLLKKVSSAKVTSKQVKKNY
ncbi:unnamed protein product [Paramecium pentaurelia]|uniref:Uncharacterized protein n=1 Tax=Paramecium pentaurelia TaxID=43138 RepID=A0A8S1UD32_9CILI|nr:unnamed protein product [Paramecium pentaurelia]